MGNEINNEESKYPSVDLAYEFVKPSYDWMANRFEAINTKIQGLITFATTITAAIPILVKAIFTDVAFNSLWFYGAIIAYVLLIIIGIIAMKMGAVRLVNPSRLYKQWLYKSHWEFKKDIIYFAGEDFRDNKDAIDAKIHLRDSMIILLLGEMVCIIVWIATAG